jgi:hypothetical protein
MYFWWCFYNPMLIVTRNLVIFSLILTRYKFSISKLTGILNIISECDFKHIMALPIKTITTLRLPAILVIMSVWGKWSEKISVKTACDSQIKSLTCDLRIETSSVNGAHIQETTPTFWTFFFQTSWKQSTIDTHVKLLICESHAVFTLIFSDHLPHWASDINSLLVQTILY